MRRVDPKRLVFVDESSTNIALASSHLELYARAPKGERAYGKVPRNWAQNITLIEGLLAITFWRGWDQR